MKYKVLMVVFLIVFTDIKFNAAEYFDVALLRRAGCDCTTQVKIDAFMSRVNNKVARILSSDYRESTGLITANTKTLKSVLGSSAGIDGSSWVPAVAAYDRAVVLINFGGF